MRDLIETHEKIRKILIDNDSPEYGDCIIDEICEVVGILPTTVYSENDVNLQNYNYRNLDYLKGK